MDPNLTIPTSTSFNYKDILLRKLYQAVACSIISQLVIQLLYIFIVNINLLHPLEWLTSALNTFTYLSTWIFVVVFLSIIFAQCIVCAKDYVFMSTYCSTRFQQLLHIFSIHNLILIILHSVIGGVLVWQNLSIVDGTLNELITTNNNQHYLIVDTFYLILSGFWFGLYFFVRIYITTKHLTFPIIQQKKFLHFRSNILRLFKESYTTSFWPTLYFAIFYYLWGNQFENHFCNLFGLEKIKNPGSLLIYLYSWWFSTLYFFTMNLIKFFFYLFLTEAVEFPLTKNNTNIPTLQDAINIDNLPIIQYLACLDLFLLSRWSLSRRQVFFMLSQPGGHPHNWNSLIEAVLNLFNEYEYLLKKSTEPPRITTNLPQTPQFGLQLQSPIDQSLKYPNIRNMSLREEPLDIVTITYQNPVEIINLQSLKMLILEKFNRFMEFVKVLFGINYLFGELPEANIQKCLGNGHLIIWSSQGIAEILVKSIIEDKYGVAQKDLPVIISSLVQLKQNLDKLNKVPLLSKKFATLDDYNYRMKNAISNAVKRSLFNICLHFNKYLNQIALNKDILQYLQTNVMLKNP